MTDGVVCINNNGVESKNFHARDGSAVKQLQKMGIPVAIITGRKSDLVYYRAEELGIEMVIQGALNKLEAYKKVRSHYKVRDSQVCYIGDDLLDLPVLRRVGAAAVVADAHEEVKKVADYVTDAPGGRAAVREVADRILSDKGLRARNLKQYSR